MIEITIHGRGGQGGVTLAKLIATAHFLRGAHAQAFGVYAAERSGAPLQAFVRIDDSEITNHNQVKTPDHVIVLDRTLIGPNILAGHHPRGWIILNTPETPAAFQHLLAGRNAATVDATSIAVDNNLGTKTVPIVNTALLGAVGRVLGLNWPDIEAAIRHLKFGDANLTAARQTFDRVILEKLPGNPATPATPPPGGRPLGLLDSQVGAPPKLKTGSWASRQPHRQKLEAPCAHACPAGNDIPGFIAAINRHDSDEALRVLLQTTPLPGVCGRVCPAPCIDACNRKDFDEAVHVRELERYAADHGRPPEPAPASLDFNVAVVGSGPAGLSCAYQLGKLGHQVTLFEAGRELGGLLRTGIPEYRLPRAVLDHEIRYILRHNVVVERDTFVNRERLLTLSHEFDAVFVAVGLQEFRGLDLGASPDDPVIQGIDFLDRAQAGTVDCENQRVVVVGGGNTAFDSARTALRLGARHVRILYRRTRDEMPAIQEEIDEALEEQIEISELVLPTRLLHGPAGCQLACTRMCLGEPDASGRRRPVPDESEDASFSVDCDLVIFALGQAADLSILPEGAEVSRSKMLLGLTGAPILLGGDLATNDGTVAHAIGNGRRAALHIHQTLTGEDRFPPAFKPLATSEVIHAHLFQHAAAEAPGTVAPQKRRRTFVEVRRGYVDQHGHDPALAEAARCFSCGSCTDCDRCVEYCPEGILVHRNDGRYDFNYDYCKGCGVCATQCPRGVIHMTEL